MRTLSLKKREEERNKYYDVLEKADRCFEEVNHRIEKREKLAPSDINKIIKKEEFDSFIGMILKLLHETVNRLKEGRSVNLNQEAVLPLRDLARVYNYSQDYLRNLINRGFLKAHKKGKLWYARVHDLAHYINALSDR